jgi:hypothetical protein
MAVVVGSSTVFEDGVNMPSMIRSESSGIACSLLRAARLSMRRQTCGFDVRRRTVARKGYFPVAPRWKDHSLRQNTCREQLM